MRGEPVEVFRNKTGIIFEQGFLVVLEVFEACPARTRGFQASRGVLLGLLESGSLRTKLSVGMLPSRRGLACRHSWPLAALLALSRYAALDRLRELGEEVPGVSVLKPRALPG